MTKNEAIGEGKLPAWASPAGMVRGWGARRAELYDVSKRKAAAAGHEKWEQLFTGTSLPRVSQIELAEESKFAKDFKPIDAKCGCYTCQNYSRAYLHHLFKVGELLALRLATIHNLRFYARLMEKLQVEYLK